MSITDEDIKEIIQELHPTRSHFYHLSPKRRTATIEILEELLLYRSEIRKAVTKEVKVILRGDLT